MIPLARSTFIAAVALVVAGCATNHALMPTPAIYTGPNARPLFSQSPNAERQPTLDLLYITDRAPGASTNDPPYTAGRSRSMAFGSAIVEFGQDVTWDSLLRESTTSNRGNAIEVTLGATREIGRFPPIPYRIAIRPDGVRRTTSVVEEYEAAKQQLQAEIARRLDGAARKEVVLFVHGYNSSFESAALTMGQFCHFLGRDFVCAIFSWPAGAQRGALFGYDFDAESSEYAVDDLLKTIRIIARTPGVERIHLFAHSRGTYTVASAMAELSVEAYALRSSVADFHIGNIVLVAPDLDGDVALTKIFKVFSDPDLPFGDEPNPGAVIPHSPGLRVTLYASPDDFALATATWLFGSRVRLGRLDTKALTPEQITAIDMLHAVDIVEVDTSTDFFGHSYYISNPYASADIVALLRYGLRPNEAGRPLQRIAGSFWQVRPQ